MGETLRREVARSIGPEPVHNLESTLAHPDLRMTLSTASNMAGPGKHGGSLPLIRGVIAMDGPASLGISLGCGRETMTPLLRV